MSRAPGFGLGVCLAAAALLGTLSACASGGGGAAGGGSVEATAIRVTLHDYGAAQRLELASEGHTDRVRYYSEARHDASRKVQTNEVMQALVEELNRQGFARYGVAGRAPSSGSSVISRALEIETDGVTSVWAVGSGSATAIDEKKAFHAAMAQFVDLYNLSASYQTIENPAGRDPFQAPTPNR